MRKRLFILFILAVYIQTGCAQDTIPKKYTVHEVIAKSEYMADLEQLVKAVKRNHPQPYAFITPEEFDFFVGRKKESISDATTMSEFVWLCKSVVALVGCGHTSTSVENVLELYPSLFFPLEVMYVEDQLYITDPLNNADVLDQGMEVISINGIDVKTLKRELNAVINSDGYISSLRELQTNMNFRSHCAFQLGFPETYTIEIRTNTGLKSIELKPSDQYPSKDNDLNPCPDNLCFQMDADHSLGKITIKSFNYYNDNLPLFQSFIDSCFKELELSQPDNLVIDLRNNYGGDPYCTSYLLQYLMEQPFRYFRKGSTKWYKDLEQLLPIKQNRFKGNLYLLINGGCFSSTGHFLSLVKTHLNAVFVGQETGATFSCNANPTSFLLTNTGIQVYVATKIYQTDVSGFSKNEGIFPDYFITPKLNDILTNKDLEMEKVVQLIHGN